VVGAAAEVGEAAAALSDDGAVAAAGAGATAAARDSAVVAVPGVAAEVPALLVDPSELVDDVSVASF